MKIGEGKDDMGEDEVGTLERLKSCRRELIDPAIKEFHGRMIKLMGDGALVEFASVVDAVQCAALIQRRMAGREQGTADAQRIKQLQSKTAVVVQRLLNKRLQRFKTALCPQLRLPGLA